MTDAAIHANVAYVGTQNDGLLRYDIANDTWLTPWISTGINGANDVPVAVVGDVSVLWNPRLRCGAQGPRHERNPPSTYGVKQSRRAGSSTSDPAKRTTIYALEANGTSVLVHRHQPKAPLNGM